MLRKQVVDGFQYPMSFIAGVLISFVSVVYMAMQCLLYLLDLKTQVQRGYANVYDIMFNFFRTGNKQMQSMMKIEVDTDIISPFYQKLTDIRIMCEDFTFSLQVGFFIAIIIATIGFLCSLTNLVIDFKTRILEARRGIFREFLMKKVEICDGPSLPGYIISSSIAGFAIVLGCMTLIFTLMIWPLFWYWIWSIKFFLMTIIIPALIAWAIDGWVQDYVYEKYYIKKKFWAGVLDIAYFFLSILEGLGAALGRFRNGVIALLIGQMRLNQPSLPTWILRIAYMDSFHKAYMGYVYMIHAHNHPALLFFAHSLIQMTNKRNQKRIALKTEINKPGYIGKKTMEDVHSTKQTNFQRLRNKMLVTILL